MSTTKESMRGSAARVAEPAPVNGSPLVEPVRAVPPPKPQVEDLEDGRRVVNILCPLAPWAGKGEDPHLGLDRVAVPAALFGRQLRMLPTDSETLGDEMRAVEGVLRVDPAWLDRMQYPDIKALIREVGRLLKNSPTTSTSTPESGT